MCSLGMPKRMKEMRDRAALPRHSKSSWQEITSHPWRTSIHHSSPKKYYVVCKSPWERNILQVVNKKK